MDITVVVVEGLARRLEMVATAALSAVVVVGGVATAATFKAAAAGCSQGGTAIYLELVLVVVVVARQVQEGARITYLRTIMEVLVEAQVAALAATTTAIPRSSLSSLEMALVMALATLTWPTEGSLAAVVVVDILGADAERRAVAVVADFSEV